MASDEWICRTCRYARFKAHPDSDDRVAIWHFQCAKYSMRSVAARVSHACDEYEPGTNALVDDEREAVIVHDD